MTASSPYSRLADALRERKRIIADRDLYQRDPDAHLMSLQKASEQIDCAARELPTPVDPNLAHYLQRCSFDKALAFLEERQT